MFPSNQDDELFAHCFSSRPTYPENPNQQQDLIIFGHDHDHVAVDPGTATTNNGTAHPNANLISNDNSNMAKGQRRRKPSSGQKDNNTSGIDDLTKRITHRDTERKRRQVMATLCVSLRDLLPFEYIKGRRSILDHMHQAANYIKDLQKKIKELGVRRDELKKLSNSLGESSSDCSSSSSSVGVVVRSILAEVVEVDINSGVGDQVLYLSSVLKLLLEEGLDVVSCVSTKVNGRQIHTIQSEVSDMTTIDLSELQRKLTEEIPFLIESSN